MRKTLILLFLLLLSACASDPNAAFIQGTWISNADSAGAGSGQLAVEWQFSRGGFILHQEIDPGEWMLSQGSYRVVESEGNVVMVELYNISGDRFTYNNLPVTYKIEIDREAGKIRINSREFERAE